MRSPGKFEIGSFAPVISAAALLSPSPAIEQKLPIDRAVSVVEHLIEKSKAIAPDLQLSLERWRNALVPDEVTEQEDRAAREAVSQLHEDAPYEQIIRAADHLQRLRNRSRTSEAVKELAGRVSMILAGSAPAPVVPFEPTDAVGVLVLSDVSVGGPANGPKWVALLSHAMGLKSTTPSGKWSKTAAALVGEVGTGTFLAVVERWFGCVGKPAPVERLDAHRHPMSPSIPNPSTTELLKGLAWAAAAANVAEAIVPVGDLALCCFTKIPGYGSRAPKLGNACTGALAAFEGSAAVSQLARLQVKAKKASVRTAIDKAFRQVTERTGLTADELVEMSIPMHGLADDGTLRRAVGDFVAEITFDGRDLQLRWIDSGGKKTASVPAVVKRDHAADLSALRKIVKSITTESATAIARLEKLLLTERSWSISDWRQRFIDHPIVGHIARRLIWQIGSITVVESAGKWFDPADHPVEIKADATVRLWHPISASPAEVLAIRDWLHRHRVTQPFKQAHREIYVLTDAERTTGTYSNRFAAHILRQHQMSALCASRGWAYRLQGGFDGANHPTLSLPAVGLSAEFFVEGVPDHTSSGIYTHVATDQVRFRRRGHDAVPLADVPPLIFSEIMRDIDLFVGVASVGNDPTWQDGGPEGRYRTYWQHYSFGELSATAATRRDVLARLVPRLKIAGRCSLTERFLVVRGSLRTYKIHLGSGNILMEPNDQYLCIVPDRGGKAGGGELFLPFEGDGTLSVILSKAFLLAADDKIADPTITRQIKP
jgi:hypothetical protein